MRLLLVILVGLLVAAAPSRIAVQSRRGETVELALADGERALVVHFWATWCPECVVELPALERAVAACSGAGVRLVAVNVGEDEETLAAYLAEHPLALPILRDPKGHTWRRATGRGLPANLIWTPAGQRTDVGPRSEVSWRATLADLGC